VSTSAKIREISSLGLGCATLCGLAFVVGDVFAAVLLAVLACQIGLVLALLKFGEDISLS
jgi:hypothetical protein